MQRNSTRNIKKIHAAQLRAARDLIGASRIDLAGWIGVHKNTIHKMEQNGVDHGPTLLALLQSFGDRGVEFHQNERGFGVFKVYQS